MTLTRKATLEDLPHILEMGRRFHAMSSWSDQEFCPIQTSQTVMNLINSPDGVVFYNGEGMLGGLLAQSPFTPGYNAHEFFWFADRGGRDLIQAFERWAEEKGANGVLMLNLTLGPRTDKIMDRMYSRRGYEMRERTYFKDLS
jgi:hypothetical protein